MHVVLADRDGEAAEGVAAAIAANGVRAEAATTDVADPGSVDALAQLVADRFGPVHVLANNAGIPRLARRGSSRSRDWSAVLGVNVLEVVHGLRSFVPGMLAHGDPCHVLNTASVGGLLASPHMAAYIASKHAVVAITECLALEVAGTAMGVTALSPVVWPRPSTAVRRSAGGAKGSEAGAGAEAVFDAMASPDRDDQASPEVIAAVALEAIKGPRSLYAPSFPEPQRGTVRARFAAIEAAMAADAQR